MDMRKMGDYVSPAERQANTDTFITNYCQHYSESNPRPPMTNLEVIDWHWGRLLDDYDGVYKDNVKNYLNKVKYKKVFLTSYWWYIIRHKRMAIDGFKCCGCGAIHDLQVHHIDMTYGIRGEEVLFMDGLQTLCETCHNAVHGKKKKKGIWRRKNVVVVETTPANTGLDALIAAEKEVDDSIKCKEILEIWKDVMQAIS